MSDILRTPDERFAALPQYSFTARYVELDGLRMHYVDEGPPSAAPILLLHGEPSWSFLYRRMVPLLAAAGHRVVAPDLIGFGRSDKPVDRRAYTYQRHVDWTVAFIERLDLGRITLVAQDWGGLIGLRIAAEHEARFDRIVAANTALPTGDHKLPDAFFAWRDASQRGAELPVGKIIANSCKRPIARDVLAAYDAPFPDERYKAGARQFPLLVPATPDDPAAPANRAAWDVLRRWTKPFLTAFSDGDPITAGGDILLQKLIPGTRGLAHPTIANAGHFLQEDAGEEWAAVVAKFIADRS
jgi:haloalkane dehalogenase